MRKERAEIAARFGTCDQARWNLKLSGLLYMRCKGSFNCSKIEGRSSAPTNLGRRSESRRKGSAS